MRERRTVRICVDETEHRDVQLALEPFQEHASRDVRLPLQAGGGRSAAPIRARARARAPNRQRGTREIIPEREETLARDGVVRRHAPFERGAIISEHSLETVRARPHDSPSFRALIAECSARLVHASCGS